MDLIEKILDANYCGDLFPEMNELSVKTYYRQWAKQVHPDICRQENAAEAFTKLNRLYDRALECLEKGFWDQTDVLRIPGEPPIKYRHDDLFELGKRYVTDDKIYWIFDSDKTRWIAAAGRILKHIRYADYKMKDLYSARIPELGKSTFHQALIVKKKPNEYPMDLFLEAYRDKLEIKDICWMISRVCDMLCFMEYNHLVYNALREDNLFINPDSHTIHLYGGWWYTCLKSGRMLGVSRDIYELMPFSARNTKEATPITDEESMRAMFRRICEGKDIPEPIEKWLNAGSSGKAILEYERWNDALDKAYGWRKFKVFTAKAEDIYSH